MLVSLYSDLSKNDLRLIFSHSEKVKLEVNQNVSFLIWITSNVQYKQSHQQECPAEN